MPLRPSYANVVSTLALVLAVSGGAYAATQLPKDSVKSKQIKNSSVKSKDLKDGTLTGADVKDGTLTGADIQPGAVDAEVAGTPMDGDLTGTFPNPTLDPGLLAEFITQAQMEDYVDSTADTMVRDEGAVSMLAGPGYSDLVSLPGIVDVDARCTAAGPNRALEVRVTNNQAFTWDFVLEQRSQTPAGATITSSDVAPGGPYSIVFAPDLGTQSARAFELTVVDAPGIRLTGVALTNTLVGGCSVNASVTYDDEGVV